MLTRVSKFRNKINFSCNRVAKSDGGNNIKIKAWKVQWHSYGFWRPRPIITMTAPDRNYEL
jgi:hypothetical protein